jgi:hypothetical protein
MLSRGGNIRFGPVTRMTGLAVGLALAALACGGKTQPAATGAKSTTPASAVKPSTTSTTAATTTLPPPTTSTTEALPASPLAAVVMPPPDGFSLSHGVTVRNGPLAADAFNHLMKSSTAAGELHYLDGYHITYDSDANQDSVDVLVVEFATPTDAQDFKGGFTPSDTAMSADYPAIPDADVFNSNAANPDGSFDHGFFATKGTRAMVVDYVSGTATPVPSVAIMAVQQYAKL